MKANRDRTQRWLADVGKRSAQFEQALSSLADRPDREVAIMCAAMLEGLLLDLILTFAVDLNEDRTNTLASGFGPLSSLSQRIAIAQAFGMISDVLATEIKAIKDIRNAFAHSFDPRSFDHPDLRKPLGKLTLFTPLDAWERARVSTIEGAVQSEIEYWCDGREVGWAVADVQDGVVFWVEKYGEDATDLRTRLINSTKNAFMLVMSELLFHSLAERPAAAAP